MTETQNYSNTSSIDKTIRSKMLTNNNSELEIKFMTN